MIQIDTCQLHSREIILHRPDTHSSRRVRLTGRGDEAAQSWAVAELVCRHSDPALATLRVPADWPARRRAMGLPGAERDAVRATLGVLLLESPDPRFTRAARELAHRQSGAGSAAELFDRARYALRLRVRQGDAPTGGR